MLNKTEKAIMEAVYLKCGDKGCCLISVEEAKALSRLKKISDVKIRAILKSLSLDNYYDLVTCDKNGEEFFCINLLVKGYRFKRESEQQKRTLIYKILLAAVTASVTFLVGRLLFYLF